MPSTRPPCRQRGSAAWAHSRFHTRRFSMPSPNTRIEHDLLGDLAVPADAYYGVQTARALENFKISGIQIRQYPNFIKGLAMLKLADERPNFELDVISIEILTDIEK